MHDFMLNPFAKDIKFDRFSSTIIGLYERLIYQYDKEDMEDIKLHIK